MEKEQNKTKTENGEKSFNIIKSRNNITDGKAMVDRKEKLDKHILKLRELNKIEIQKQMEYKEELKKYHGQTNLWDLRRTLKNFKQHMNKKQKIVFNYLILQLTKEEILYKISDNFYIIVKDSYFYFEMCDDLSAEFINIENKQNFITLKFKKDVDNIINHITEVLK